MTCRSGEGGYVRLRSRRGRLRSRHRHRHRARLGGRLRSPRARGCPYNPCRPDPGMRPAAQQKYMVNHKVRELLLAADDYSVRCSGLTVLLRAIRRENARDSLFLTSPSILQRAKEDREDGDGEATSGER